MKLFLGIFMFSSVFGFYSCDSDDGPDDGGGTGGTTQTALLGKYNLSDNDNYGSVEFTGNNKYIVTKFLDSASGLRSAKSTAETKYIIVIFGDYTVNNQSTENNYVVDLQQFGTITINISDSGNIDVTINDGENTYNYTADKGDEVVSSEKTKLLCNTWNFDKSIEDGEEYTDEGLTITFTSNGTYTMYKPNLDEWDIAAGMTNYSYGSWSWIDSKTIKVEYTSYSATYSDSDVHYSSEQATVILEVVKLTEKELVWYERDDEDSEGGYTMYLSR
jgi:hypothetical protein